MIAESAEVVGASGERVGSPRTGVQQVLVSRQIGGAGVIAIELAAMVKAHGLPSRAWVPGAGPASAALEAAGVPWTAYALEDLQRGGLAQLSAWISMGWRLRRHQRSLIHVHNPIVYGFLSPMLRFAGMDAVVTFHLEPTREEILWALRYPPAMVMTCARYIAAQIDAVAAEVGRQVPTVAIQNAIQIEQFGQGNRPAAKRRVGAAEDRWLVLMLANLSEHKGQLTAVRAVRELLDRGIAVDCWLAGEERGGGTGFTDRVRASARDLGVADHVRLLGYRRDGAELMQAADCLLLPSTLEGLPLSILEAQAAGTIAIGSPIPGISEVVEDGVTGFLVSPDNAAGYADRIEELIRHPERRARIARVARAYVEAEHTWARYIERTQKVYAEAIRRHRR